MYHVYGRVTRREPVFAEPSEANAWVDLLREVKTRDGFVLYAWCLLSNHYHLLLRTVDVPLWRTMATLQGAFTKRYNRRHGLVGPFWQGRYKAKLVEDQRYFDRLVVYIHLNPVVAGVVSDPADHLTCGHREALGKVRTPIMDVDQTLSGFGDDRRRARRSYARAIKGARTETWAEEGPGRLPWWRFGRSRPEKNELQPLSGLPYVDDLGRSSGLERPRLSAEEMVARGCAAIGADRQAVTGTGRERAAVRSREALALVAIERFGIRAKDLAEAVDKSPDTVSRWLHRASARRREDSRFAELVRRLDVGLASGAVADER
jgi:REP element-mobilizing transposase RayT